VKIEKPLVIIDEAKDGGQRTIICEIDGGWRGFAIVIADAIKHAAICYDVTAKDITQLIEKELKNPTTQVRETFRRKQ
jgi:hypothetical protein